MKILGKNIFVGDIGVCTEHTEKMRDDEISHSFKWNIIESNVVLIKDKLGYFVPINEVEDMGSLAMVMYGSVPRYSNQPHKINEHFATNIKHYLCEAESMNKFTLKDIVGLVHSNNQICTL